MTECVVSSRVANGSSAHRPPRARSYEPPSKLLLPGRNTRLATGFNLGVRGRSARTSTWTISWSYTIGSAALAELLNAGSAPHSQAFPSPLCFAEQERVVFTARQHAMYMIAAIIEVAGWRAVHARVEAGIEKERQR